MSKIILRRDFSDESVIQQFADLVGNVDNLRMLVLVTYADIKAVNNEALRPCKACDPLFLFSKIPGVLSYFGMNILRGQAFSNRHGTIFDLITFEDVDN